MPRLPISEVSARTGRTNSPALSYNADPDAFGASIGRATEQLGQAMQGAGNDIHAIDVKQRERKSQEEVANKIAMDDWTRKELELRNQVNENADNYQQLVRDGYIDHVESIADTIEDDDTRVEYRQRMMSDLPNISSRAAQYELSLQEERSKTLAGDSLNALRNKIALEPTKYDDFIKQGGEVIRLRPNIPAALKEGMVKQFGYDSAKTRFEGMIATAKTLQDLDNIERELKGEAGRDWTQEFIPSDFTSVMSNITDTRTFFRNRLDKDATAVVGTLEERQKEEMAVLPVDDVRVAQEKVQQTDNPEIHRRLVRLQRDQKIIQQGQRLTPAELRAQVNFLNGDPASQYPNLPPEVSNSINVANLYFPDVGAGFLGGTATAEYGSKFKKTKRETGKFPPTSVRKDVDFRNISPQALDALSVAGDEFGQSFIVTSGTLPSEKTTGMVSISTASMSPQQLAKAVGSLVDAGFTRIEQYDGRLTVGFADAVPNTYGEKDGKAYGGWTGLSQDVFSVLQSRGFAPGAKAADIIRKDLGVKQEKIDYGAPTEIKGPDGKPTSSAVGLYQFTEGTWKEVMKYPAVVAATYQETGIDVTTLSDEELLKLRADPMLSTLAAAAYASKNNKALSEFLGREINDAEKYLSHLLGPQGAPTFMAAYEKAPDTAGADLMPEAAKANKPLFYDGERKRTLAEIYNTIGQKFSLSPSQINYEDNRTREKLAAQIEERLKTDPLGHASKSGTHVITDVFAEEGFKQRGTQAVAVADYFNIPRKDMKPFREPELAYLKKKITEGNTDDNLAYMAAIQTMGPEMADAALKQLDETDGVFSHAAQLYLEGDKAIAADIVRGRKRLQQNPALKTQLGKTETDIAEMFVKETDMALSSVQPVFREAIQNSALNYYVEKATERGIVEFDKKLYKQAIQAVMGGTKDNPAIGRVNGHDTYIPKGFTADQLDYFVDHGTTADLTELSPQGAIPQFADGEIVSMDDIRNEMVLRYVGDNTYKIMMDDGTFLTTGNADDNGNIEYFLIKLDKARLDRIKGRPKNTVTQPLRGRDY